MILKGKFKLKYEFKQRVAAGIGCEANIYRKSCNILGRITTTRTPPPQAMENKN